jgi:hypothetical protein
MNVHQTAQKLVNPMQLQKIAIMQIGHYFCDNCNRGIIYKVDKSKGTRSMLMLTLPVDKKVLHMQTMLTMFYQEQVLLFVMLTAPWYGAANFKLRLHY